MKDKCMSAIMGSIIGDAIGVPYEFRSFNEMAQNPCTDMVGHGTYNKPAGTWSDDSSMTLATMDALTNNEFELNQIMLNFIEWQMNGKYTQDGFMFDIGNTTREALNNYKKHVNVEICGKKDENSNGNGSLMRIMPVALYIYNKYGVSGLSNNEAVDLVKKISSLTHAHEISVSACLIYVSVALHLLNNEGEKGIIAGLNEAKRFGSNKAFDNIFSNEFLSKDKNSLSGKGYVVNTLEDAIYFAYNTNNYKQSILESVNLGDDTDTTATVTGGLTGIMYGISNIDGDWIDSIRNKELAVSIIEKFTDNLA